MRNTFSTAVITLALSVAVILAFATSPAMANSMQDKDKSATGSAIFFEPVTGNWGNEAMTGARITEPAPGVFANAELGATAERDRRFVHSSGDWGNVAMAGATVTEPAPDVFANAELSASAERDRRFMNSRFARSIAEPTATMSAGTDELSPGVFASAEFGASAERDRRFIALNRDLQRGEMPSYEGLRPLIYEGPQSEWFDPWAGVAGAGGYNYDYWFAPRHVR